VDTDRGQSEVAGVVLFTGVVVTLVTVVAVTGVFPLVTAEDAPSTTVEADLTTTTLTVTHAGGDPLAAEDVTVVVRDAGGQRRVDADAVVTGTISPGDTLSVPASLNPGDRRRVLVVHEPSNTLLFDGRQVARLAPGTGSALRWTRPISGGLDRSTGTPPPARPVWSTTASATTRPAGWTWATRGPTPATAGGPPCECTTRWTGTAAPRST
jgi:flagellin-like protein